MCIYDERLYLKKNIFFTLYVWVQCMSGMQGTAMWELEIKSGFSGRAPSAPNTGSVSPAPLCYLYVCLVLDYSLLEQKFFLLL